MRPSAPLNLFDRIPADLPQEWVETLVAARGVRVERIVSNGHRSADGFWYDQDTDEFVVLLSGAARVDFDGQGGDQAAREVPLRPGDWLLIPAHRRHRVAWTAPDVASVWLAVHVTGDPPANDPKC